MSDVEAVKTVAPVAPENDPEDMVSIAAELRAFRASQAGTPDPVKAEAVKAEAVKAAEVIPPAPKPAPAPDVKAPDAGVQALMQKDAQLRADRQALQADRAKHQAERALLIAEERKKWAAEARSLLEVDPAAYARQLGIDKGFADIAASLYVEELGDDAPPAVKEKKQYLKLQKQIEEQKRLLESYQQRDVQRTQQAEQQRLIDGFKGHLKESLATLDDTCPQVRRLAKHSADKAVAQLFTVAQAYAEQNPGEPIPPFSELASMYETSLREELAPWLTDAPTKTVAPPADEKPAASTLSAVHSTLTTPPARSEPTTDEEILADVIAGLKAKKHLTEG